MLRNLTFIFIIFFILLSFSVVPTELIGQEGRSNSGGTVTYHPREFDIDFSGGTLKELINQIEKTIKATPNIVTTEEAGDEMLPKIKLNSVTTQSAMMAVVYIRKDGRQVFDMNVIPNGKQGSSPICVMSKVKYIGSLEPPKTKSEEPKNEVYVFSIAEHLRIKTCTLEDITTSIETAWKMLDENTAAVIKFHSETNLLIIRCNVAERGLVVEILRNIE